MSEISKKRQSQEQQDSIMTTTNAWCYILPNIFQYLEMKDRLSAAQVCTTWRGAAAHPSLWKTVRLRYCKVSDWEGLANILQKRDTQKLDLRHINNVLDLETQIPVDAMIVISRITSLVNLRLSNCSFRIIEQFCNRCPQLKVLTAEEIDPDTIHNLKCIGNLKQCQKLRIRTFQKFLCSLWSIDLTPLQELIHLKRLSLTLFYYRDRSIDVIRTLTKLETLELGLIIYPKNFETILLKLKQLKRLRLERFKPTSDTFKSISKLENLSHLELVYFQLNNDFKYLAYCKNIKRLLIIFRDQIEKTSHLSLILESVKKLSTTLTHFVIGVPSAMKADFKIVCDFTGKHVNQNSEKVVTVSRICSEESDSVYELYGPEPDEEYMNKVLQKDCLLELQDTLPTTRVILIHMPYINPEYWYPTLIPQRERRTK